MAQSNVEREEAMGVRGGKSGIQGDSAARAPSIGTRSRKSMLKGIVLACALTGLAWAAAGCSSTPDARAVVVTVALDSPSYEIGQAVVATVSVRNNTDAPLVVPALDESTLSFYWGQDDTVMRVKRWPVTAKNLPAEPRVIPPGAVDSRKFLFTGLTPEQGKWGLMTSVSNCMSEDEGARLTQPYYSRPVWYAVGGEVKFERDPYSGIIVKHQAVELARAYAGAGEEVKARAALVPLGETGLMIWTVFMEGADESAPAARGYTVNAYTGVIQPLGSVEASEQGGKQL